MNGKILIVEDNENLAKAYKRFLMRAGYQVECAADGMEGMNKVRTLNGSCSLILLDILLPKMNGIQLLSTLRNEKYETPVIVISQVDEPNLIDLDVFDVLHKPITGDQLVNAVERVEILYKQLESEIDHTIAFLRHLSAVT